MPTVLELGLLGDQWRRDLDDRVAAVVGAADEAGLEEARREEAAKKGLALVSEKVSRVSLSLTSSSAGFEGPSHRSRTIGGALSR